MKNKEKTTASAGNDNAKTQNANWEKFKSESAEKMDNSENRVEQFKEKAENIKPKLRSTYNKKVAELEQNNIVLKKKMKDFVEDIAEQKEKFTKDFNQSVKDLS